MAIVPIILGGGLDLVRSKQEADPGSLSACKNFEVANKRGYTKMQGIRAFSTGVVNDVVNPYVFHTMGQYSGVNINGVTNYSTFIEGREVYWGSGGNYDEKEGTLSTVDGTGMICFALLTSNSVMLFALCNIQGRMPTVGDVILTFDSNGTATVIAPPALASTVADGSIAAFGSSYASPTGGVDGASQLISDFDLTANADTHAWPLPCNPLGSIRGGFLFKDEVYAVVDIETRSFTAGATEPPEGATLLVYYTGTFPTGSPMAYTVDKVITESGDWSAGTAAGKIQLILLIGTDQYSSIKVPTDVQMTSPTSASDPLVMGAVVRSPSAMLMKQGASSTAISAEIYERVDLGHEVRFNTGSSVPTVLNRANRDITLEATVTTTAWLTCGTAAGWTNSANAQGASDGVYANMANDTGPRPPIICTNFAIDVPSTAVILGVEMRFTRRKVAGAGISARDREIVLVGTGGSQNKKSATLWPDPVATSSVYGSASDLWGASISADIVNATGFGVSIAAEPVNGAGGNNCEIDSVEIRLTYKDRSSVLYFGDPTTTAITSITRAAQTATVTTTAAHNFVTGQSVTHAGADQAEYNITATITVTGLTTYTYTVAGAPATPATTGTALTAFRDHSTARLIWYHKDKGDWGAGNDAEGTMTLYSLSSASAIRAGQLIRTAAAGAGTTIATAASGAEKVYLPSSNALATNASQWEFTPQVNFFGSIGTEQIGGVSGAGPAFTWDGTYCIRIRTGLDANQDKPRHIAKVGDQLALGYLQGVTMVSDLGYPESFAGVVGGTLGGSSPISDDTTTYTFAGGAQEIKHGDSVYGILPLADQSTAVFCQHSIQMLVGAGGTLVTTLLPGSSGIIEYTHGNIGVPVFIDYRGVGTLTATDAFGNFARGRLSDHVAPWLVPRLQQQSAIQLSTTGIIKTEIIRNKNQFRMYFLDRWCLTMTMVGNDFSRPEFTTQYLPFVPAATFTGITSGGKDLFFIAPFGMAEFGAFSNDLKAVYEADANIVLHANMYAPAFLYQGDVGTTWDLKLPIDAYIEVNGGASGREWETKHYDRMVVGGQCFGFAPFGVNYGVDFGDIETGTPQNVNGGSTSGSAVKAFSEQTFSQMENVSRDGYALSLKFVSSGASVYGATTTQASPYKFRPFTLQSVILLTETLKTRRGGS